VNVAVIDRAASSVTVQVDEPLQAPLQPVKLEPAAATAVSVTVAPLVKSFWQLAPQAMPAGLLATEPLPVPVFATVRCTGRSVNVAVTDRAALIATLQVAEEPAQAPLQPVKLEPAAAVAVSVTVDPLAKSCSQVAPQAMPAGELVIEPFPVPALAAVRWNVSAANVAVTDFAALIGTVHVVDVVLQAPFQRVKLEPGAGVAVSVTFVPWASVATQVAPQSMPAGLLVTVPLPVPALATVRS
jgi:hypothetical protein